MAWRSRPRHYKRQRLGVSTTLADRLSATDPDGIWALDYQFDATTGGKTSKIHRITDEYTQESLCDLVAHSIDADATVAALDKVVGQRGQAPASFAATTAPTTPPNALRDWGRASGAGTSYIGPGSPWQSPWVESCGSLTRHEPCHQQFDTLLNAQVLAVDWK